MSPPPPDIMVTIGLLLHLFSHGSVLAAAAAAASSASSLDCVAAEQGCVQEQACMVLYRVLEYCAAEEAVAPLGADARWECLEAQNSLQQYRPLQVCKCQRGSRREEHCLRVYWTVRFAAYEEYDVSPYEELELNLVRHIEMSRMASIMAASSLTLDGQNQCLKAAQDCGLYEKCGSLRSEYVVACTKRVPSAGSSSSASDGGGGGGGSCNRQKCHRALRRFLERVPEEYSFALLFCPCSDTLCGERRRKTIVPSCSYEEQAAAAAPRGGGEERTAAAAAGSNNNNNKPNCLSLQNYCTRDELCRSRLADFQHNCQSSQQSPSGCVRESRAMCLKAYAGLIGTIMTPNYVSNSSMEVSQWCGCEGSGNEWQGCQRILHMFTNNVCLRNAISSMGSAAGTASVSPPHPAGGTPVTPSAAAAAAASRPSSSPRVYQEREHGGGGDHAPRTHLNSMEEESDEEDEEDEEDEGMAVVEDQSRKFNVIPPYSDNKDKDSAVEPVAKGSQRGAAHRALAPAPMMLPLMLMLALVGPGVLLLCWG